jgi:hypothetical protein
MYTVATAWWHTTKLCRDTAKSTRLAQCSAVLAAMPRLRTTVVYAFAKLNRITYTTSYTICAQLIWSSNVQELEYGRPDSDADEFQMVPIGGVQELPRGKHAD